jgi:hypothetical protein
MAAVGTGLYAWDQRRLAELQATEAAVSGSSPISGQLKRAAAAAAFEDHSKEAMRIQQIIIQAFAGSAGGGENQSNDLVQMLRAYQRDIEQLVAAYPADNGRRGSWRSFICGSPWACLSWATSLPH